MMISVLLTSQTKGSCHYKDSTVGFHLCVGNLNAAIATYFVGVYAMLT